MSNSSQPLFAKSKREGRKPVTLQEHLEDTEKAAREVFNLEKRWGKNWCRFFKLYEKAEQEKFLLNLRIAALFHDIGKANEDFQRAVSQNGFYQQTIRHEHLSALILHLPEVREWLLQNENLDLEVITGAVLSHHIKASAESEKWKWMQPKGKLFLQLFDSHNEIHAIFDQIKEIAELPNNLRIDKKLWSEKSPWIEAQDNGFDTARDFKRLVNKEARKEKPDRRNLLLAVKAGLIASDAVASGLVREGERIENWINEKAHSKTICKDEVATAIIDKRAEKIFKDKPIKWNDFQLKSATLGKRALLLAACGSGKTIAAWKWAEAQSLEYEIGKVIFLYPTRGTATEGFKDYVGYAPETEASLLHGTAKYELEEIRKNPSDDKDDKNYETNARLFALGFWGKRYFSATVDQFLSFLEHSYSSLCLLPVLADSAVIIDEIHSFDKQMFENLVCFLHNFDIPVLCMTATLPKTRIENLEKVGLRVYPNKEEQAELKDLEEKEVHPRYNLEFVANEDEVLKIATAEYKAGKRVLWVVNTVKRCQNIAKQLKKEHEIKALVYHSRFRLKDRKKKHEATVDAFKQTEFPKIAITTQVCEMSLDLDADVLITEIAPIPSLVQRFGRSNRNLAKGKEFRSRLVVYMPESDKPYNQKDDLEPALTFLKDLPEKDISQRCMAEMLIKHSPKERQHEGDFAPFLSSGYYAVPGNFREIDNFTNPCILSDDLAKVKSCLEDKKPIDAYVISIPKKFSENDISKPSWLPKYLGVADSKFYFEDFGFMTELEDENE
jgi:CRISPR-associated endonuclease/helicase Cas3